MRIRQRLQQYTLKDAEDYSIRAHSSGQGDQRDHSEHRRTAEPAQDLPQLVLELNHWNHLQAQPLLSGQRFPSRSHATGTFADRLSSEKISTAVQFVPLETNGSSLTEANSYTNIDVCLYRERCD